MRPVSDQTLHARNCTRCEFGVSVPRHGRLPDTECRRYPTSAIVGAAYWCGEFREASAPASELAGGAAA